MTDPDRRQTNDTDMPEDERSDLQQAVEARADAVARGEGGQEPDGADGEGGAGGVVKNQDDDAQ
jgi:hypothetical protein